MLTEQWMWHDLCTEGRLSCVQTERISGNWECWRHVLVKASVKKALSTSALCSITRPPHPFSTGPTFSMVYILLLVHKRCCCLSCPSPVLTPHGLWGWPYACILSLAVSCLSHLSSFLPLICFLLKSGLCQEQSVPPCRPPAIFAWGVTFWSLKGNPWKQPALQNSSSC